jgi:hypothetical protein
LELYFKRGIDSMEAPIAANPNTDLLVWQQMKMVTETKMRNGINWFYWIAALSVINTIIYILGLNLTFVVGLSFTQLVDGFAFGLAKAEGGSAGAILRGAGVVLDIAIAGLFAGAGYLGRKRYKWVVICGMILYGIDAIVYLGFKVYMAAAFHALGLFGLYSGLKAMLDLAKLEKQQPAGDLFAVQQAAVQAQKALNPKQTSFRKIGLGYLLILAGILILYIVFTAIIK